MTTSTLPTASFSLAAAISASLFLSATAVGQHLEKPDDPPAQARAPGGRPPVTSASTVQRGPFVSRQVNIGRNGGNIPGDAANEPSIVVDPTDPRRIVIGWRQFDTIASNFRQNGWSWSHDRGQSWTFPGVIERGQFNSDPVLDADAQGNLYYLSYPGGRTLTWFRSTNAGVSFSRRSVSVGGDKAWMMVDRSISIGRGHIYCIWQVVHGPNTFIRSTDGGASWSSAVPVPETTTFGTLATDAAGVLYAGGLQRQNTATFVMSRSTTARDASQTPSFSTVFVAMNGRMRFGSGPNPGGLLGQAGVATDPSRPNHVYMLCSVNPPGNDPLDVHFVRSIDGGQSFSAPVRVNDDPVGTNAWQWFGTMSVAPNGRIDVVFNDTRADGRSDTSETCYAFSLDAGVTWSKNVPFSPQWNSLVGHPNQNKIGDYYDMISDDAEASLAYSATFNGEQDVYYVELGDCNENAVHDSTDIQTGTSFDSNANTIPDECEFCQSDLGFGAGLSLRICGDDLTTAGSRATMQLYGGPANSPVVFLIAFSRLTPPLQLPGGISIVPDPANGFPLDGFSTNVHSTVGVTLSGGANNQFTIFVQAGMLDSQSNLLVSNAVEARLGF